MDVQHTLKPRDIKTNDRNTGSSQNSTLASLMKPLCFPVLKRTLSLTNAWKQQS